jgi:hypothetical protein
VIAQLRRGPQVQKAQVEEAAPAAEAKDFVEEQGGVY